MEWCTCIALYMWCIHMSLLDALLIWFTHLQHPDFCNRNRISGSRVLCDPAWCAHASIHTSHTGFRQRGNRCRIRALWSSLHPSLDAPILWYTGLRVEMTRLQMVGHSWWAHCFVSSEARISLNETFLCHWPASRNRISLATLFFAITLAWPFPN